MRTLAASLRALVVCLCVCVCACQNRSQNPRRLFGYDGSVTCHNVQSKIEDFYLGQARDYEDNGNALGLEIAKGRRDMVAALRTARKNNPCHTTCPSSVQKKVEEACGMYCRNFYLQTVAAAKIDFKGSKAEKCHAKENMISSVKLEIECASDILKGKCSKACDDFLNKDDLIDINKEMVEDGCRVGVSADQVFNGDVSGSTIVDGTNSGSTYNQKWDDRELDMVFNGPVSGGTVVQGTNSGNTYNAAVTSNSQIALQSNGVQFAQQQVKPCEGSGNGGADGAAQVVCCQSQGSVCCASAAFNNKMAQTKSRKCPPTHPFIQRWSEGDYALQRMSQYFDIRFGLALLVLVAVGCGSICILRRACRSAVAPSASIDRFDAVELE